MATTVSALLLMTACSSPPATDPQTDTSASSDPGGPDASARAIGIPETWSATIDPTAIPLGDDRASTTPEIGGVFSCVTDFTGRGATRAGPWIDDANGTWDATAKVAVDGAVSWPEAVYTETVDGDERVITSLGVPIDDTTGTFPIAGDDPAFEYDPNPNQISARSVEVRVALEPSEATEPSCMRMGATGMLSTGVYLYNALDDAGHDAVAHEIQDSCGGHPDPLDHYHDHNIPTCLLDETGAGSTLVGYALAGFGIYVERDSVGNLPTNADLDECHGRTSTVMFNGTEREIYHYSATAEFPFTIGCYRGTPASVPGPGGR